MSALARDRYRNMSTERLLEEAGCWRWDWAEIEAAAGEDPDSVMTRPGAAKTEPGGRQDATPEGLSVAEAVIRMAVTPDAIRRRLHRGTLAGAKTVHIGTMFLVSH